MDTLSEVDIFSFLDGKSYYAPVYNSGGMITDKVAEIKILHDGKENKPEYYDSFVLIGQTYRHQNLKQVLHKLKIRNKPLYSECKVRFPEEFI